MSILVTDDDAKELLEFLENTRHQYECIDEFGSNLCSCGRNRLIKELRASVYMSNQHE